MSEIKINYNEVYAKAAQMHTRISSSLREMDAEYRQIQSRLNNGVDGAAAAAISLAIEANRRKSQEVAETLEKLISFMENSTRRVELEEKKIANIFHSNAR